MTADPLRDPVTGGSKPKAEEEKKPPTAEELEDELRSSFPEVSVARGGAIYGGVRFDETLPSRDFITITRAAEDVRRGRLSQAEWWDLVYRVARMRLIAEMRSEAVLREALLEADAAEAEAKEAREDESILMRITREATADAAVEGVSWGDIRRRKPPMPERWDELDPPFAGAAGRMTMPSEVDMDRMMREALGDWPPELIRSSFPSRITVESSTPASLIDEFSAPIRGSYVTYSPRGAYPDWMMRPTGAANPSPPDLAPSAWSMDFRGQPRKKSRKKRN